MAQRNEEFQIVDGVKIPKFFSVECFETALNFNPAQGDIFVASYPKSGTTWMQNVVLNILRRGKRLEQPRDFFLASPFLDQLGAEDSKNLMIRPGAYKTHLPFDKVPWSDEAKYIYVARNPKDCCISFYHHMQQIPGYQFSDATFDEFFEIFITGQLEFGDYFDHILSWYNERKRPNVCLITYEEMKKNLRNVVLKIADFIQEDEAQYLQRNVSVLDNILLNCSFEEMKFLNIVLNSMYDNHNIDQIMSDPDIPKGRKYIVAYNAAFSVRRKCKIDFIRKGETDGWKKVLTIEQNKRINEKLKAIEHCSDLIMIWKEVI